MSNKVPCGGFYLDDTLGVNENGELSIKGGTPYQQLVTDGESGVKWEDRLAYDDSKLVISNGRRQFVKVADEVPSWATVDTPIKLWTSAGISNTATPEDYIDRGNGSFLVTDQLVAFIVADNYDILFPEKGVYFFSQDGFYVTGIASADSDTPEITWDGDIGVIKKLDEKFLPEPLILYVHESGV